MIFRFIFGRVSNPTEFPGFESHLFRLIFARISNQIDSHRFRSIEADSTDSEPFTGSSLVPSSRPHRAIAPSCHRPGPIVGAWPHLLFSLLPACELLPQCVVVCEQDRFLSRTKKHVMSPRPSAGNRFLLQLVHGPPGRQPAPAAADPPPPHSPPSVPFRWRVYSVNPSPRKTTTNLVAQSKNLVEQGLGY